MKNTPRSNRSHIALFGRRNTGKSSLINAITGQSIAVVSKIPGTTTDPVYKNMEVLPLGPVVFIDTPGIDDNSELGKLRIGKTNEVLRKTDIALLVLGKELLFEEEEINLTKEFKKRSIPFIIVANQQDKSDKNLIVQNMKSNAPIIKTSALTGYGINELINEISKIKKEDDQRLHLVDGIVKEGDMVIMVTPVDKSAPKGRLILPQQQVLRDIIDHNAIALVVKDTELNHALKNLKKLPNIVITDSQVFDKVNKILPNSVPLTSFSIIYAREKGDLQKFYEAIRAIDNLQDGDFILVAEGCTHHRKDDDIGTVKIPNLLTKKTGKNFIFHHISGGFFEEDLGKYKMVIHCGACMLNKREMQYRQDYSQGKGVPMVNYGIILALLHGILDRALKPFWDEIKTMKL
jgi:[FeFe] hydrogenase H-cluster maturation GTPase HydF